MTRSHKKEFHEQDWCPPFLRDMMTDVLSVYAAWSGCYGKALRMIAEQMRETGETRLVDLCSGRGKYIPVFLRRMNNPHAEAVLTDLHPHAERSDPSGKTVYDPEPLTAEQALRKHRGIAVMFSALHHLDEDELRSLCGTAAREGRSFAFFDYVQRDAVRELIPSLCAPLMVWTVTLFVRPRSWRRFFWTYLIPAVPALTFCDGILSRMRAYRNAELDGLLKDLNTDRYRIESGRYSCFWGLSSITYLTGGPKTLANPKK